MNNFVVCVLSGALFLLAFLLFLNPNKVNNRGNKWFSFFIFCIFCILVEELFEIINLDLNKEFYFEEFISLFSFMIAPVFYFTVTYYVNPEMKWKNKNFIHFILVLIYLIMFIISIGLNKNEINLANSESNIDVLSKIFSILLMIIFTFQLLAFSILSYKKLINHQKNIKLFSSNIEEIDLNWLKYIIICVIALSLSWVLDIYFSISNENFSLINFILLICVLIISYYAIKQKEVYPYTKYQKSEIVDLIQVNSIIEIDKKKLITEEKLNEIKNNLIKTMTHKKPFLDSELTLLKLASELAISSHTLSYVINNGFNENFYQFVNRFRIEEAKKLILNPKMNHLSILGIAFEVGFNSKTVFNTTFKKITGLTPSEFKKNKTI